MKITALRAQVKNTDRVNVFVDGKYSFSLTLSEVVDHAVRKDMELDEATLTNFKKISTDGKTRMRAYEWLMGRPHSTREFTDYLRRKKAEPELIASLADEFTQKGILSDERFAQWFAERAGRKHKSARMTQNELRSKGVGREVIDTMAAGQDRSDVGALQALLAKLQGRPRYADQAKLIRYLLGKGFSYSDVKDALNKVEPEQSV